MEVEVGLFVRELNNMMISEGDDAPALPVIVSLLLIAWSVVVAEVGRQYNSGHSRQRRFVGRRAAATGLLPLQLLLLLMDDCILDGSWLHYILVEDGAFPWVSSCCVVIVVCCFLWWLLFLWL